MKCFTSPSRNPVIMLLNARSLLPKVDELRLVTNIRRPTIICITETWLNDTVDSCNVGIDGYELCRMDRCYRRGGGAAVYICRGVHFEDISQLYSFSTHVDSLVLEIYTFNIILICIYVPPSVTADTLRDVHEAIVYITDDILSKKPFYKLVITGDMNKFKTNDLCAELDLLDIINKPTRGDHILDHVLMTKELATSYNPDRVTYDAPIGSADHRMLTCIPDSSHFIPTITRWHKVFDFRKSHLLHLSHMASSIKWYDMMSPSAHVNDLWEKFHSTLLDLVEQCIPWCLVPATNSDKEWMTPVTKKLILDRWAAYRSHNWPLYNHLKEKVKLEIVKSKQIWAAKLMETPKGLWKLVSQKRVGRRGDLSALVTQAGSEEELLSCLLENLKNHFSRDSSAFPQICADPDDNWSLNITEHQVRQMLRRYPSKKAAGIDGIPTRIYVELADIVCKPLALIFNQSCVQRLFPDAWKTGIIVPVPKTTKPDLSKLRFLTLLPLPSKLLERLILKQQSCELVSAFGNEQHGFRRNASATTALLQLHNKATKIYDDASKFGAVILNYDLTCAFDHVDHSLLLRKLHKMKFSNGFLKWLGSYFHRRCGILKINAALSKPFSIQKGVPQGSVLGPPLFCAYVKDFTAASPEATVIKYADDLSLILPLNSSGDIHRLVDDETDNLSQWCVANRLKMNPKKSTCLLISRHPVDTTLLKVNSVSSVKTLGVYINTKLNWDDHVEHLRKLSSQRLHILRQLKGLVSTTSLQQVYAAIVRSPLEHACPLFLGLNKKQTRILCRIERRAHHIMNCNIPTQDSFINRHLTLSSRIWSKIEADGEHLLKDLIPEKLPRSGKYAVQYYRTDKYGNSYFPFMTRYLNDLVVS